MFEETRAFALVPDDRPLDRLPPGQRGPGVVRDHREPRRDRRDQPDSRDRGRRRRVEGAQSPAGDRAPDHAREAHPGTADVARVHRLPAHDAGTVHAAPVAADQPELRRALERRILGDGARGGRLDELAVAERAARRRVHHAPPLRAARAGLHAPARGGRGDQHLARRGAGLRQRKPERADAAAAGRAEAGVVRPRHRLLEKDGVDVDLELLGDDHRQRGPHALSHLGLAYGQDDPAGGVDADPRVRAERGGGAGIRARESLHGGSREAHAEHEAAGGDGRDPQEVAARAGAIRRQDAVPDVNTTPTTVHFPPSFRSDT